MLYNKTRIGTPPNRNQKRGEAVTEAEFKNIDLEAVCARCDERAGEHKYDGSCPVYAKFGYVKDYLAGFHYLTFTTEVTA